MDLQTLGISTSAGSSKLVKYVNHSKKANLSKPLKEATAGFIREAEGCNMEAIQLYLKGNHPLKAAQAISYASFLSKPDSCRSCCIPTLA